MVHRIALTDHFRQQQSDALRRIETGSAADIGIGRRIVVEHNSDLFRRIWFMSQDRPFLRLAHQHIDPFRQWLPFMRTVFRLFPRRHRHRVKDTVKLGHGDPVGYFGGAHPGKTVLPPFPRIIQIIGLQHRHADPHQHFQFQKPAHGQGKNESVDQRINANLPLVEKVPFKSGGHARSAGVRISPAAKYGHGVASMAFDRFDHRVDGRQMAP